MPIKVLMPALSPTMTEGTLAKWHVKEGDEVSSGDVLAEIETDKATMEVEAVDEGRVGRILVGEGTESVKVNQAIALLLEEGEDEAALELEDTAEGKPVSEKKSATAETSAAKSEKAEPAKAGPVKAGPVKAGSVKAGGGKPEAAEAERRDAGGEGGGEERLFASPLARRMAAQAGLDLGQVSGSGPNGRIVKRDVEEALAAGSTPAAPAKGRAAEGQVAAPAVGAPTAPPPAVPDALEAPYELVKPSSMRRVIAERLTHSKQTVPHFYLTVDCAIDKLLAVRKDLNARGDAYKISVNDMIIKAAAIALRKVPAANASWAAEGLKMYRRADISVAVSIEGGLITPVIRDAGNKGLEGISTEMRQLAEKAREGKLKPEEYLGGTFSISNLGMFGVKHFDAVINPPQGCILAIGAGEQRPVVKDGILSVATVMSVTLSVDHRAVDGAVGAQYLQVFKGLIEDPLTMLL